MTQFPYRRLHSHPTTHLADHLEAVGSRTQTLVERDEHPTRPALRRCAYLCGSLHDIGKATLYFQKYLARNALANYPNRTYDFAPGFDRTSDLSIPADEYKNHAPLGTFVTYEIILELLDDQALALAGFIAVAKHHGILPNVLDYLVDTGIGSKREDLLCKQVKSFTPAIRAELDEILDSITPSNTSLDWDTIEQRIRDGSLRNEIHQQYTIMGNPDSTAYPDGFYDIIIQLWGALVVADKTTTAGLSDSDLDGTSLRPTAIDAAIRSKQYENEQRETPLPTKTQQLNEHREDARQNVISRVQDFANDSAQVATITLPTGLGKTLTGFQAALLIRTLQTEATGRDDDGRVIYALPFTSIIDQTLQEAKQVFSVDHTGSALTVQQHLEDTVTAIDEDAEGGETTEQHTREEFLLGSTWNTGMVLSTYVALFESLVKPTNKQSLKLPSLYNSVIILDEPQSLPVEWWRLIRRVTQTLIEEYNATVISMTATQPRLFTAEVCEFDVFPLVDDVNRYFGAVERVEYSFHDSIEPAIHPEGGSITPCSHTHAAETIVESISDDEPSALAVCNTVASANTLSEDVSTAVEAAGYDEICLGDVYDAQLDTVYQIRAEADQDEDEEDENEGDEDDRFAEIVPILDDLVERAQRTDAPFVTLHLTARHRPIDRRVLIDVANALTKPDDSDYDFGSEGVPPFVCTSTQLVEAGVDVSFARVYRDLAPMTSIVQAAGRCNRSFERDTGIVTIWKLASPDHGMPPSECIYAGQLTPTIDALRSVYEPGEPLPETRVARQSVECYYDIVESRDPGREDYVQMLDSGRFLDLRRNVDLIEERETYEVFVCRSQAEISHGEELMGGIDDVAEARQHLDELALCRVSVPQSKVSGGRPAGTRAIEVADQWLYIWTPAVANERGYSTQLGVTEE